MGEIEGEEIGIYFLWALGFMQGFWINPNFIFTSAHSLKLRGFSFSLFIMHRLLVSYLLLFIWARPFALLCCVLIISISTRRERFRSHSVLKISSEQWPWPLPGLVFCMPVAIRTVVSVYFLFDFISCKETLSVWGIWESKYVLDCRSKNIAVISCDMEWITVFTIFARLSGTFSVYVIRKMETWLGIFWFTFEYQFCFLRFLVVLISSLDM